MLIQFRVENHRSLRDEQILSLAASSEKAGEHVLKVDGVGEAILPVIAIYGANASGKSNVLDALGFLRVAVMDSHRRWDVERTPHDPFRLSSKAKEPSLYEVDIVVDGVRFRYGFQISALRIEEEWLFAWPHGRKATWFEREGDDFEFGKMLHGENETIRTLTRPNSLFLSAAAQNNHPQLLPLVHYFRSWRFPPVGRGVMPGRAPEMIRLVRALDAISEKGDRSSLLQLLQAADTGIVDVRVDVGVPSSHSFRGGRPSSVKSSSVHVRHRTADEDYAWLPLALESAGTLALLELAPDILDTLGRGGLLCVDELEASLHPALAVSVVRLFNDPKTNPNNAQLIFATHDTNLLGTIVGEPALRRDQVWFTEKDDTGATHLYPLTDFHPRKEENLERGYLQGRYGATPFVGELLAKVEGDQEG